MPFDCTSPHGADGGQDPAPTWKERAMCRALFAGYLVAGAAYTWLWMSLVESLHTAPFLSGGWIADGAAVALTTFVCAAVCPSWHMIRALAAGRWP